MVKAIDIKKHKINENYKFTATQNSFHYVKLLTLVKGPLALSHVLQAKILSGVSVSSLTGQND